MENVNTKKSPTPKDAAAPSPAIKVDKSDETHFPDGRFKCGPNTGVEYRFVKGSEKAKRISAMGGRASQQKAREHKALKEVMKSLLDETYKVKQADGTVREATGTERMLSGLFRRSLSGDPKAVKLIAELIGEYAQSVDVNTNAPVSVEVNNETTAKQLNNLLNEISKCTQSNE